MECFFAKTEFIKWKEDRLLKCNCRSNLPMLKVKGQKEHKGGMEESEMGRWKMKIFRLFMGKKHLFHIYRLINY